MNEIDKESTIDLYVKALRSLAAKGTELRHEEADDLLCTLLRDLGFEAVVYEYNALQPKWYA